MLIDSKRLEWGNKMKKCFNKVLVYGCILYICNPVTVGYLPLKSFFSLYFNTRITTGSGS